ncbi:hypothetical protein MKEN_00259600 [Mycena kentingensis (nom. inval.)]|nr:hypothetical protein MKEN_00259600 [Mycena kentingensis (nom. inval.)]
MNTLANHGYIPRNGIASFEELINGMTEAFNLPVNMAAGMAANNFALLQLGKFGDDGPDGNSTVFNINTLIGIKKENIAMDQANNPQFTLNAARHGLVFADSGLILNVFANGTTKLSTLPIIGSFFRNETFPENWFRSAGPVNGTALNIITNQIRAAVPIPPGRNNAQGVYVPDPPAPAPWDSSVACTAYWDQNGHVPSTLITNSTGVLRQNVNFLLDLLFKAASVNPGCTEPVLPFGEPDT